MARRHISIPWFGIFKFMWITLLVISVYLLGMAMVHHHFNRGGLDYHQWRDSR